MIERLSFSKQHIKRFGTIAQLGERLTVNQDVAGSSPAGSANNNGRNAVYPWETGVIYCGVEQR